MTHDEACIERMTLMLTHEQPTRMFRDEATAIALWENLNQHMPREPRQFYGRITESFQFATLAAMIFSGRPLYVVTACFATRDPLYDA